jgi:flagellar basal-body rod modification protein FlgD
MVNTVSNPLSSQAQAGANTTQSTPAGPGPEHQISKDVFLKLMVAQLQNQNPLNPVDGVDFLMQLSQISGVEQMVEMRRRLEAIHDLLEQRQPPALVETKPDRK